METKKAVRLIKKLNKLAKEKHSNKIHSVIYDLVDEEYSLKEYIPYVGSKTIKSSVELSDIEVKIEDMIKTLERIGENKNENN